MQTEAPCSDYKQTKGLVYFARMLDKIRLKAQGRLPEGYWVGIKDDPTHFDARCTRFLNVDYDELADCALQGGSNEEILEWCFQRGRRPSEEEIEIWNAFILKRGWNDKSSAELEAVKKEENFAGRHDIRTWVDLHDAGEGRTPRSGL
jgi:hypothetical protein